MKEKDKERKVKKVKIYSALSIESGMQCMTKKLSLISERTGLKESTMRTWFWRNEGKLIYSKGEWKVSVVFLDEWDYSGQKRGDVGNLVKPPVENKPFVPKKVYKETKLEGERRLITGEFNDLKYDDL